MTTASSGNALDAARASASRSRVSARSTMSTSRSLPVKSTASSARTAPASRRSSRSSPVCTSATPARCSCAGQACGNLTPHQVEELGIQFIHQEQNLVSEFTVAQAVFMGQEKKLGQVDPARRQPQHGARSERAPRQTCSAWTCRAIASSATSRSPSDSWSRSPRPCAPIPASSPSTSRRLPSPAARWKPSSA